MPVKSLIRKVQTPTWRGTSITSLALSRGPNARKYPTCFLDHKRRFHGRARMVFVHRGGNRYLVVRSDPISALTARAVVRRVVNHKGVEKRFVDHWLDRKGLPKMVEVEHVTLGEFRRIQRMGGYEGI